MYIYIYIYIIYETIETATKGLLLFVTVFSKILTGTGSNAVENKMHPTLFLIYFFFPFVSLFGYMLEFPKNVNGNIWLPFERHFSATPKCVLRQLVPFLHKKSRSLPP